MLGKILKVCIEKTLNKSRYSTQSKTKLLKKNCIIIIPNSRTKFFYCFLDSLLDKHIIE